MVTSDREQSLVVSFSLCHIEWGTFDI